MAFFYGIYNALGQRVGVLLPGSDLRQQRWYLRPRALRDARIGWPFRFDRFDGGRVAAMKWAERDADDNAWSTPEGVGQGRDVFEQVQQAYASSNGATRQLDPGVVTFTGPLGQHVGSVFVALHPSGEGYLEAWSGNAAFVAGNIPEMRMEVVVESRDPQGAIRMGMHMAQVPPRWTTWLLHDR